MENFYECDECKQEFKTKEKLLVHHQKNHMIMNFTCEECDKKIAGVENYHQHLVKIHQYEYCDECNFSYRENQKHFCGEPSIAYLCSVEDCKERYYSRLNYFVRHLQIAHQIADFSKIKQFIANNCKAIIKPYKSRIIDKSKLSSEEDLEQNQQFLDLKKYVLAVQSKGDNISYTSTPEEDSYAQSENNYQKASSSIKKEDRLQRSQQITKKEKQKEENIIKKENQFSSSTVLHQKNKNNKQKFSKYTKKESQGENEYELLLCRYKDNKRFIKSIKYEDLLLKALSLVQSIQRDMVEHLKN